MASATAGYPLSAIVGHDRLRLALVLSAVRPDIGGVLIRGEKGTAKSTAVRALASVLGSVDGARLVELPIGATEDRVVGSWTYRRYCATANTLSPRGFWRVPTVAFCTWTRSTYCMIT